MKERPPQRDLHELIADILALLERYGERQFMPALEQSHAILERGSAAGASAQDHERAQQRAASNLLPLYGGMASFSDVVLAEGWRPAVEANDRLAGLRNELYDRLQVVKMQGRSR